MHTRAAWVSLLLSSPALAAPPQRLTDRDLERMQATIEGESRSVEEIVKVAEEAGQALEYAPTQALQRLMHYVHAARSVAYARTSDPSHACALLGDAELLLSSRKDAPEPAVRAANQARSEATRTCVPSGPTATASNPPRTAEPATQERAAPVLKEPGPPRAPESELRRNGRMSKDTAAVLAAAGVMSALSIGVVVIAAMTRDRMRDGVRALQGRGYRLPEDDALLELNYQHYKLGVGMAIGGGVAAAALFGVAGWLIKSDRAGQPNGVSLSPFGGARQAGLMLSGRF